MDWIDSVARLLDAIAWPVALLIVILLLREPLAELIRSLKRVRYGGFGAEFGRKVQELEARADEAELPDTAEEAKAERLAAISPRAAVTEAWREVELSLREHAEERGYPKHQSTRQIAKRLTDEGVVSPSTMNLLDSLRQLRNEAVHAEEVDLSPADALEYSDLADRVKYSVVYPST